jgi:predicted MFS family arabinose efflux permease
MSHFSPACSASSRDSSDDEAPVLSPSEEAAPREGDTEEPSAPTEEQAATTEKPPRFAALRHRNFRVFWGGNLLSNMGTFAQQTAQGWLVRTLSPNEKVAATNLALVAVCSSLPVLIFSLYGGVLADRVDKRRALMLTNGASMALAILLALLVTTGAVQVWHVALVALGVGLSNAFDIPVRQAFNREMVGPEDIPNAIALNSSSFNAARVLGPALGGLALRFLGIAACFWANAASFGALLWSLSRQKLPPHTAPAEPLAWADFVAQVREGVRFVRRDPVLWHTTALIGVVSFSTMSFGTLLPVFARDVFRTGESGYAALMFCNGLGALGSAVSLAAAGQMKHKGKRLLLGCFGFCVCVALFALSPNLYAACVLLIAASGLLLTALMTANTMVQTLAPDEMRGRIFSVYSLALIGTAPLGAAFIGFLARQIGPRHAVAASAMCAAGWVFAVWARERRGLWKEK